MNNSIIKPSDGFSSQTERKIWKRRIYEFRRKIPLKSSRGINEKGDNSKRKWNQNLVNATKEKSKKSWNKESNVTSKSGGKLRQKKKDGWIKKERQKNENGDEK